MNAPSLAGAAIAVVLAAWPPAASAHSGGTDANGCHVERASGLRHCHGGKAAQPSRGGAASGGGAGDFAALLRQQARAFSNCAAARAAGAAPVRRGDAGYSRKLDRDGDGVGCE